MTSKTAKLNIPVDELVAALAPQVEAQVRAYLTKFDPVIRRRDDFEAFEVATTTVVKALERFENASGTRDETPARNALIASTAGLRRAYQTIRKGK